MNKTTLTSRILTMRIRPPARPCAYALPRLWAFLDDELSRMETWLVGQHLADCTRCGTRASAARRLLRRVSRLTCRPNEAAALRQKVSERLRTADCGVRRPTEH